MTNKDILDYRADRCTDWTPKIGDCVAVSSKHGLRLGILRGTGGSTVQYNFLRSWTALLMYLKGHRERPHSVNWVQKTAPCRWGVNSWREKIAPYPPTDLNEELRLTIFEIQDVLDRHGKRRPLNL